MRTALSTLAALVLSAAPLSAEWFDCSRTAARRVAAPAAGVNRVVVIARAGSLKVTGRPGAVEVVAAGTACSSDSDSLSDIVLRTERHGSALTIEAVLPQHTVIFGWYAARLNFEVTLPANLAVEVRDTSGAVSVENVGSLSIEDGSGEIIVRNIAGNLTIEDGSGEIEISGVGGNVTIEDDGSGGVDVEDVRGHFVVRHKGSGSLHYDRIGGRVSVPERHARSHR